MNGPGWAGLAGWLLWEWESLVSGLNAGVMPGAPGWSGQGLAVRTFSLCFKTRRGFQE